MFPMTSERRRETAYPMARMNEEFSALFNRFFGNWPALAEPPEWAERAWNLELTETEKDLRVRAEVPGFEPEEFALHLTGDALVLKAEHKHAAEEKENGFTERHELRYERRLTLPAAVEPEKAEATYRNGVLEVRLPKAETAKTFRVPVK